MNRSKKCSGLMNSSKNKLNSEIIFIFHWYPNGGLAGVCELMKLRFAFLVGSRGIVHDPAKPPKMQISR